jgi:hypothetical protein
LNEAFKGSTKTFYSQEIEKWLRLNPRRFVSVYQSGKRFGNNKQAATGSTAANGCRAPGLFPNEKNISDHMISLWRQVTYT